MSRYRASLTPFHSSIHPLPSPVGNLRLLADQAQNLVDAGRLGKVDVRGEADLFKVCHFLGGELIIEVSGHDVGIDGLITMRNRQSPLPSDFLNPSHQVPSKLALGHLMPNFTNFGGAQGIVEPGEEGPQGESHRSVHTSEGGFDQGVSFI